MARIYVKDANGTYVPTETTRAQRAAAGAARTASSLQAAAARIDVEKVTAIAREAALVFSPIMLSVRHNRKNGAPASKVAADALKVGIPIAAVVYRRLAAAQKNRGS